MRQAASSICIEEGWKRETLQPVRYFLGGGYRSPGGPRSDALLPGTAAVRSAYNASTVRGTRSTGREQVQYNATTAKGDVED